MGMALLSSGSETLGQQEGGRVGRQRRGCPAPAPDRNLLGAAQHAHVHLLQLEAQVLRDHLAGGGRGQAFWWRVGVRGRKRAPEPRPRTKPRRDAARLTVPPVSVAMSAREALRLSPNPGALTAQTLTPARSLLTMRVASASAGGGAARGAGWAGGNSRWVRGEKERKRSGERARRGGMRSPDSTSSEMMSRGRCVFSTCSSTGMMDWMLRATGRGGWRGSGVRSVRLETRLPSNAPRALLRLHGAPASPRPTAPRTR